MIHGESRLRPNHLSHYTFYDVVSASDLNRPVENIWRLNSNSNSLDVAMAVKRGQLGPTISQSRITTFKAALREIQTDDFAQVHWYYNGPSSPNAPCDVLSKLVR